MLAPLLLLWPISIAATHQVANDIANEPYDQALAENVGALSRLVRVVDGRVTITLPASARTILHADEQDELYYQVRNSQGRLLAGDEQLPAPSGDNEPVLSEVRFRDERLGGDPIRIAYKVHEVEAGQRWVVIQVAETRHKREALASRIISGVLLPQFAIIPLAVVLVWLGLSRGLRPLSRLRERMATRRPGDLSPIDSRRVPEEVQPMVRSFNQVMARLEENLQAQQRFIADAAHQMKTPVTGLRMQAELATRETDPAQLRRSVEQIAQAAERAGHLITQLLTLARAESSHEKLHRFESVDLEALARAVTLEWVDAAQAKNGGLVTVRVIPAEHIVLEVEDNGIGVAEDDRERIFERFYRVLGTDADGSGLGLAICREIAELHRAAISLIGGPGGRGSRVVVVFPRAGTTQA